MARKPRTERNLAVCESYKSGLSLKKVGLLFGISDMMVLWILRKYGVERRPRPAMRRRA